MPIGDFAVADVVIVVVIVVSAVWGVLRGLVKEVVALVIWVAALLLGVVFAGTVGSVIADSLGPRLQVGIGFGAIFIVVLVAGAFLQRLLGRMVDSTGLTGTDRTLGLLFGAVRGGAVVVVGLIIMRPLAEASPWWPESRLIPMFLALEGDVLDLAAFIANAFGGTIGSEPIPVEEAI
ncbi:MAG: CvpA family protein [Gammaproteobacteria bacterium]|nr:CvpA family protein [Gammaproteobacteria bacterium]